eukprot:Pgem_evm2s15813
MGSVLAIPEDKGCEDVFTSDTEEYKQVDAAKKAKMLQMLKLSMNANTMTIVLNLSARERYNALLEKYK